LFRELIGASLAYRSKLGRSMAPQSVEADHSVAS
jgi:hypothetical protein